MIIGLYCKIVSKQPFEDYGIISESPEFVNFSEEINQLAYFSDSEDDISIGQDSDEYEDSLENRLKQVMEMNQPEQPIEKKWYFFYPDETFYMIWEFTLTAVLLNSVFITPYTLAFPNLQDQDK